MRTVKEIKTVVIPFNNYISELGVYGPIDIPVKLETQRISNILSRKIPVYEILKDGSKLKLDLVNYNKKTSELSSLELVSESNKKKNNIDVISISDEEVKSRSVEELLKRSTLPKEEKKIVEKPQEVNKAIPINNINKDKPKKNFIEKKEIIEDEIIDRK